MKENEEKQKVSTGHRILTVVGAVLCILLIPILVMNCTLIVKSYLHKDEVPSIGGKFPMIILTDSMEPEFSSGDLILCHEADPASIQVGDIICFYDPSGNGTTTVTHRVIQVDEENGSPVWTTKGDANNAEDAVTVSADKLVGVYDRSFAGLGNIAMFMQTTKGLILCVVCPILLLVIYDILRRRMYEKANKKDTEALMAELNALRAEKDAREKEE